MNIRNEIKFYVVRKGLTVMGLAEALNYDLIWVGREKGGW